MTLTQNITLDVARETALHIAGKQFDENSRFLLVTIKEAGEEKSIPAGSTITLNARRPDGSAQSFAGSIQDGKAFVEIDQWILEQYGTVYCSISVVDSEAAKLTTLSFRLLVERAEGSGFVLVYVAAANLAAGTYYITMAGVNYSFTTTQAVPAGGKIYFSSNGTTGKTTNNGATIETLTLTAGSTGTELQGSDIVNFLTQMQANVAAIDGELDSKADKSAIEENLTAGTSLATIDPNSYTPHNTPYLYRQSPSGKRCEYDVIGGTVGWNQLVDFTEGSARWLTNGTITTSWNNGILTLSQGGNATAYYYQEFKQTNSHKILQIVDCECTPASDATPQISWYAPVQLFFTNIPTTRAKVSHIISATATGTNRFEFRMMGTETTITCYGVILCDLTTLLGSTIADYAYQLEQTTAGSGIAWLKSFGFLTKSYYPYSEPTLESVQATARKAVGINIFDKDTMTVTDKYINDSNGNANTLVGSSCTDFIEVIPNTAYYIKTDATSGRWGAWYDADKNFISGIAGAEVKTAPTNARYIRFTINYSSSTGGSSDTFCINLSNPTINGQYFPYDSHTYPLGDVTLRGIPKLDSNNNIYYDGDVYKADGTITRKYGIVDLGTLTWARSTNYANPFFYTNISSTGNGNIICPIYVSVGATSTGAFGTADNMSIGVASPNGRQLYVRNDSYTDATTFKTAMNGVYFVYELATPTTETTDPFTPIQYTGSTEAFTTENDVPVGVDAKYYTDLTLPTLPTANGTYTLKCTVTDGTGIVSWVSE